MSWKVLFFPLVSRLSKKESERSFLDNGSMLLEDLIASCDGKSNPIRCYSAAELMRATNNFDPSCIIMDDVSPCYQMFRGILDDRTIIIKKFSIIPCVKRKEEKEERKRSFLKNGSILLKDLIASRSCDGKSHPIRCYSAAELNRVTNNFDRSCFITDGTYFDIYRGILDDRTVIIKKHYIVDWAIRDIIISMQMSAHKNSLKLLGCCLEFDTPALVFENAGKGGLNDDGSLAVDNELLPWKTRLRIAKQLASALTYLHTAFPRPIVHRNLRSTCILLDDDNVPKLSDFSFSITIPPDQLYVQDNFAIGTSAYMDPTHRNSRRSSERTDVYIFGVLLLVFLTRRAASRRHGAETELLIADSKLNVPAGQIQIETIADPKILEEVVGDEQAQQQLQDFLALALLCIQDENEARPDMIDVAKELVRIDKSILP